MVIKHTGLVRDGFHVLGPSAVPQYLLDGPRPVLFDAGLCCLGRLYEEEARSVLGRRQPEILFLTHLHFDHCGAVSYLKRAFPGLKAAASEKGAQIMKRPNAVKLITALSEDASSAVAGVEEGALINEPFQPFEIDLVLTDGQVVDLGGGVSLQVLATPGHTWDFLSYYVPEKKILIGSEAVGCAAPNGYIVSDCLADYDAYLTSLKRLAGLDVEILCQGHNFVYLGPAVADFFSRSIAEAERFRDWVERLWQAENGDLARIMELIRAEEYDPQPEPKQPESAYLINLQARVKQAAARLLANQG